jgi:hypothetical protein
MMPTTKITQKIELLELIYSKEVEIINAWILESKESIYENGNIHIPFDKVLNSDKKYTRDNLIQIADIFENHGWYVKIIEAEEAFDFS